MTFFKEINAALFIKIKALSCDRFLISLMLMKDVTFCFQFWLEWTLGVQCKQFSGTVGGPQVIKMVSWETRWRRLLKCLNCMQMANLQPPFCLLKFL